MCVTSDAVRDMAVIFLDDKEKELRDNCEGGIIGKDILVDYLTEFGLECINP